MPRRGSVLSLLVVALLGITLVVAPTAPAVDEPAVRLVAEGAEVRGTSQDGRWVLLQSDEVSVADGYEETVQPISAGIGGSGPAIGLGISNQGSRVIWRRGSQVFVAEAGTSRLAATLPAGARVESVGAGIETMLLRQDRPHPQGPSWSIVDLASGTTTPIAEEATSVLLTAHGSRVVYVTPAGVFRQRLRAGAGIEQLAGPSPAGPETVTAVSSDGEAVALTGATAIRVVTYWIPPIVVDAAPDGSPLTDLRAIAVSFFGPSGGLTFTGRVEGKPQQVYRHRVGEGTTLVSTGADGGPLPVAAVAPVASDDGTTVVFQTIDGPGTDAFGAPVGRRLHVRDLASGEGSVLCCELDPGEGRQFPAVALGRSGGQIAFTTSARGEGASTHRWDRPVPRLALSGIGTFESIGDVNLSVELEAAQHEVTRLRWDPVGPAPDADLIGYAGSLEIPAGQRYATIPLGVVDDDVPEPDEQFELRLTYDDGRPGEATAIVSVSDDDREPRLSIPGFASTIEHGGRIEWTLELHRASDVPVTVDWSIGEHVSTSDDRRARAGEDFTPTSGTATFAPGVTTLKVSAPVMDDTVAEPEEVVHLQLSNLGGGRFDTSSSIGFIADDDQSPPVAFVADTKVAEDGGPMTWTVRLDRPSGTAVTVGWRAFQDTSAPDGREARDQVDFNGAGGTVTFAPGATSATVSAVVRDDALFEADEWFVVELLSPSGASLGRAKAVGVINDDESATLWGLLNSFARF